MKASFTAQQIANIKEAIVMWKTVPPKNVYPGLDLWRDRSQEYYTDKATCNTVACFGGWCCHWPAFQDQGVYAGAGGAPELGSLCGGGVAEYMFGDIELFLPRGVHPADRYCMLVDDHTVVMNRLKTLLAKAEKAKVR